MKTQYFTATSIDGFIADSKNSLDWLMQFGDGPGDNYAEFIKHVGALAMGSTTYEWVLNELLKNPNAPQLWPYKQPCWIFSTRSLKVLEGANLHFVKGDVKPVYNEMCNVVGGSNIWLVGGGELVGQFHDHGLLDEIILGVAPVFLGAGAPLLPRRIATPSLKLLSVKAGNAGFVEAHYEVIK